MKMFDKKYIIGFIIGAVMFSGITGVVAYKLYASQVGFSPTDDTWNVEAVDTALNSLYDIAYTGDATSSDILSGKSALVQGSIVNGSLTIPNYTTISNSENVAAGSSSTARTGYFYLDNYNVSCGTTTCPNYTSLSGTQNVGAGSSSTLLNGYYNLSNYKVSCGGYSSCSSCCSCPACNSCCGSSITWSLSTNASASANPSVTSGRIYLLMYSASWTINSGATALTSVVNMGSISGQTSFWQVVKATSSTISLSRPVRYFQIGY